MHTPIRYRFFSTLTLLTLALAGSACKAPFGDLGNLTDESTGASETSDSAATEDAPPPATEGASSTLSAGTTDEPSATEGGATEGAATDGVDTDGGDTVADTDNVGTEGTTGELPAGLEAACQETCALLVDCAIESDASACAADCIENLGASEPVCAEAAVATLQCLQGMTCEQLVAAFDEEEFGACAAQVETEKEVCSESEACQAAVGESEDGGCQYWLECPSDPVKQINCVGEVCECFEDGVKTGECAAEGVCLDLGGLSDKAEACCGF